MVLIPPLSHLAVAVDLLLLQPQSRRHRPVGRPASAEHGPADGAGALPAARGPARVARQVAHVAPVVPVVR